MPKYLVEQNKSSTFAIAFEKQGWLPEWPNGADCKSAGYAFGGSNPSPPTFPNITRDKRVRISHEIWIFFFVYTSLIPNQH